MPLSTTPAEYDLAIVGGGLVGASLALSLAPLGLRIALVEAVPPVQGEQHPSFDERTTALANGTVRAFKTLGVWTGMEREAAPIRKIHVSDQGRFGSARIDAAEQGLEALGYVVPNRAILNQAIGERRPIHSYGSRSADEGAAREIVRRGHVVS